MLCTGAHKRTLKHYSLWREFHFNIVLNIMKLTYIFPIIKNMKPTEYGVNKIRNLFTRPHKEFGYNSDYSWKRLNLMMFYAIYK